MTLRQGWPKADLLQQRRLELGLPLEPAQAPPLLSLVLKGGIAAVVAYMVDQPSSEESEDAGSSEDSGEDEPEEDSESSAHLTLTPIVGPQGGGIGAHLVF